MPDSKLIEKVLESGLVDKATAALMEKWGYIEPGSTDKVKEEALKNATKDELIKLTEKLAVEVERENALRETYLDLERLRWPVVVTVFKPDGTPVAHSITAVIDRMGRYYFRIQDVDAAWFVPGHRFQRGDKWETIWEVQTLSIGEQGICVQVSVEPNKKG